MRRALILSALAGMSCLLLGAPAAYRSRDIGGGGQAAATGRRPVDILITGGTVITMDPARRVIEDGAVAVVGERIEDVGLAGELQARYEPRRTINARYRVIMPGLIDGHGHAGHGLVKSLGEGRSGEWYRACEIIYAEGSTEEFWRAEALLAATERLKFGVTTGITFFGGGDSVMRTDDPRYGDAHLQAVETVGIREFLAVGPRRPPFPRKYPHWSGESRRDVAPGGRSAPLRLSSRSVRAWRQESPSAWIRRRRRRRSDAPSLRGRHRGRTGSVPLRPAYRGRRERTDRRRSRQSAS